MSAGKKRKVKEFRKVGETSVAEELEPYWKKPKQSHFDFFFLSVYPTDDYTNAKDLDVLWLMIINLSSIEIPMWIGWNTLANPPIVSSPIGSGFSK